MPSFASEKYLYRFCGKSYKLFVQKSFRDTVYEISKQIPKGKVATYGQIAVLAGSPGASRAVGMYMKQNPNAPLTPCHRVVAFDGKLIGYSVKKGVKTKREMLEREGVVFVGDKVNLSVSQWKTNGNL